VDDRTLKSFDAERSGALPRGQYAPMLARLRQAGAAVIALDVIFQRPKDFAGDRALFDAIRATHDRLVLPYVSFSVVGQAADGSGGRVEPELFERPGAVEGVGVTTGYAGLPNDRDRRNRRADYEVAAQSASRTQVIMPAFAFAAARVAGLAGLSHQVREVRTAKRRAWGGQSQSTTWIDFRGPAGTIRRVSALDVIHDRVPAATFRDKAVVIGVVAPAGGDIHRTPLDSDMPGAEVQANALDTMLRGDPLRDAPAAIDVIAIVVLACAPVAAALWWSGRATAAVVAALAIALLAAAQLVFQGGWIVAVVVPLAALALATLGVAGVGAVRVVLRRRMQRTASVD
jgi:CHASE2 domain-containing sensor protein